MYDGNTPENPHIPAWLIFDQRYRDRYVFAGLPPGKPLPRRWYAAGSVVRADDLAGLAAAAGLAADGLAKTVTRFNEFAAAGQGRGLRPGRLGVRPVLRRPALPAQPEPGPAGQAAVLRGQDRPGDLGTKGGLRTD